MISYCGRHRCKQFIPGKSIRFGYKMRCLNSSDSYLINFDLYQWKNAGGNEKYDLQLDKAASPIVSMIEERKHTNHPHNIHVGNLFTGMNLFGYPRYEEYGAIRENRFPKSCFLTDKKKL